MEPYQLNILNHFNVRRRQRELFNLRLWLATATPFQQTWRSKQSEAAQTRCLVFISAGFVCSFQFLKRPIFKSGSQSQQKRYMLSYKMLNARRIANPIVMLMSKAVCLLRFRWSLFVELHHETGVGNCNRKLFWEEKRVLAQLRLLMDLLCSAHFLHRITILSDPWVKVLRDRK